MFSGGNLLTFMFRRTLISEAVQTEMEATLWMAEKHPVHVASFLLAGMNDEQYDELQ